MNMLSNNKYFYPVVGIFVIAILLAGSALAFHAIREERGESKNSWGRHGGSEYTNLQRAAVNTASGVDVVITTADTGSIARVNAEFEILKGSAFTQNSAYTISGTKSGNSLKISISSMNSDVVKLIQEDAANGASGLYGISLLETSGRSESNEKERSKERNDRR